MSNEATENLGVEFSASGLDTILANLRAFRREVRSAGRAYDQAFGGKTLASSSPNVPAILKAAQISAVPAGIVATSTAGSTLRIIITANGLLSSGGSSTAVTNRQRTPWLPSGPRQQLTKLWDAMHYAVSIGNTDAFEDSRDAYNRTYKRIQGPAPGERLASIIGTSRFGLGNVSPLVGRSMELFGGQKAIFARLMPIFATIEGVITKLGPWGLVIAGGVEASRQFISAIGEGARRIFQLAEAASSAVNTFTRFTFANGGSAAANAQLYAIGRAGGISTDEIAGITQAIQSRISTDPVAMAAGVRLGVYNLPLAFGRQDLATQTLQVVKSLRDIHSPDERLRLARSVGAEGLLPLTMISNKQFALAQQDASVRSRIMSPDVMQRAADFQASLGRVMDAIQNLAVAASPALLSRMTDFFNKLATIINGIADWLGKHQGLIENLLNGLSVGANIATGGIVGGVESLFNASASHFQGLQQSLDKNTSATAANTAALGLGAPGAYGNATRGEALGSGMLNGLAYRMAMDQAGFRVSTF